MLLLSEMLTYVNYIPNHYWLIVFFCHSRGGSAMIRAQHPSGWAVVAPASMPLPRWCLRRRRHRCHSAPGPMASRKRSRRPWGLWMAHDNPIEHWKSSMWYECVLHGIDLGQTSDEFLLSGRFLSFDVDVGKISWFRWTGWWLEHMSIDIP